MSIALGPEPLVSNRDTLKRASPRVPASLRAICLSHSETPPARVMTPTGFTKQFRIFQIAFWGYATAGLCHQQKVRQRNRFATNTKVPLAIQTSFVTNAAQGQRRFGRCDRSSERLGANSRRSVSPEGVGRSC